MKRIERPVNKPTKKAKRPVAKTQRPASKPAAKARFSKAFWRQYVIALAISTLTVAVSASSVYFYQRGGEAAEKPAPVAEGSPAPVMAAVTSDNAGVISEQAATTAVPSAAVPRPQNTPGSVAVRITPGPPGSNLTNNPQPVLQFAVTLDKPSVNLQRVGEACNYSFQTVAHANTASEDNINFRMTLELISSAEEVPSDQRSFTESANPGIYKFPYADDLNVTSFDEYNLASGATFQVSFHAASANTNWQSAATTFTVPSDCAD